MAATNPPNEHEHDGRRWWDQEVVERPRALGRVRGAGGLLRSPLAVAIAVVAVASVVTAVAGMPILTHLVGVTGVTPDAVMPATLALGFAGACFGAAIMAVVDIRLTASRGYPLDFGIPPEWNGPIAAGAALVFGIIIGLKIFT
jgi:hypothetical protein